MKTEHKTVLMVMLDAFRHDYVTAEDSPFLYSLAQEGASGSLIPSFGFEPDGAYLAGLDPEECDGGAQYWKNQNERAFFLTSIFGLLHHLPSKRWHKLVRHGARFVAQMAASREYTFTRRMSPTSEIPFRMLSQFSFPMKKLACDEGFTSHPTIFDELRAASRQYFFHGHPVHKVRIQKVVDRYLAEERGGNPLAFLFIGDLDRVGHEFGPDSDERRGMLRKIDAGLQKIYQHALGNYTDVDILVFGDHGMADVKGVIDFRNVLDSMDLDGRRDTYFLDSTFARFWVSERNKREYVQEQLNCVAHGHVLTEGEKEEYRIRYPHNYFGDIIFVVDDNYLIHPSFYSSGAGHPAGMHGYLPGCRDNESAFVLHGRQAAGLGDQGRIDMRRIYPTVLDLLRIAKGRPMPHQLLSIIS